MVLSDVSIKELCVGERPLIENFIDHCVREVDGKRAISFGLAPDGYDARIAPRFKIFNRKPLDGSGMVVLDPKKFNAEALTREDLEVPQDGAVAAARIDKSGCRVLKDCFKLGEPAQG